MKTRFLVVIMLVSKFCLGQSNWKKADSLNFFNNNDTSKIYRKGGVAISHAFLSPFQNKLLVTEKYYSINNRGAYFSLNEPRTDLETADTTTVGLANNINESHNVLVANNFANFKQGLNFLDVHNSTAEFNFFRGSSNDAGFRDGGNLIKASVLKLAGNFNNNSKPYRNTEFDLLNLRFFTGNEALNPARINNFYAIRLEDFRGINPQIIENGWGLYIKPAILNNYFGGKLGIGTTNITHQLTIDAVSNPLKIGGLADGISSDKVLAVNAIGEVSKSNLADFSHSFISSSVGLILVDNVEIYIHKGGNVNYTLPSANTRTGKTWKITNIGSGTITTNIGFYEGDILRNTIINKSGANSFSIFSDGIDYIAIK
jgi:hypothetical protein